MDIASLGLAIDSSQAEKGALALTRLSTAAKRAEVATARAAYSQASANLAAARASDTSSKADIAAALAAKRKAAASLEAARAAAAQSAADRATAQASNAAAAAMNAEAASATKAAGAMRQHAIAVNDNVRRMGGSFSGLAAQFQDIGVTAAMEMNPMIIALQQGTQIAGQLEAAMDGGGSAASVLGEAFRSLFSPLTLVTIALTALVAAGLQMVDWPAAAAWALNLLADNLQTIAPYAVAAAAGLALLYAPAIIGGVVQLIALMGRLAVSAIAAAVAMAAANPAAAFVLGITAAVAAAVIFRDELAQIFGFDIVGAAKDGINQIVGFFLGAYDGVVAAWGALPGAFGDLGYQAANKFIEGINWMVGEVVSIVNGLIAKINGGLRSAVGALGGDAANAVQLNDLGSPQSYKMGGINNPYAGSAAAVGKTISDSIAARQGIDYVGEIGDAIGGMASSAAEKLRSLAGSFGGVGDAAAGAGGKAGKAAKDATDPWKGLRDVTQQTASAFQEAGQGVSGILSGLIDGTLDWKDALQQALSVGLKLLNDLNVAGGGKGLFGGGFLQGLLGGLLGFAGGGYTGDGATNSAAGVVHGKEYVFNARATARIGKGNLDAMHRAANGYQNGGYVTPAIPRLQAPANDRPQDVRVTVGVDVDGSGNLMPFVQSVAQGESAKQTGTLRQQVPGMVDRRFNTRQTRKTRP